MAATDALSAFFRGLTEPDRLAADYMKEAGVPIEYDDQGLTDYLTAGRSKARAAQYQTPYSTATANAGRESLVQALQAMRTAPATAAAAGARSMSRLGQAAQGAGASAMNVGQRLQALRAGGEQATQVATEVGQGAAQEEFQQRQAQAQGMQGVREGDLQIQQGFQGAGIEQQKTQQALIDSYDQLLAQLAVTKEGARVDYKALLDKVSDEARAGSTKTLMALAETIGSIVLMGMKGG